MLISKSQYLKKLVTQLKSERESFIPLYKDLADYIDPSRAQFNVADNNKGDRRNLKIIDSTATFAANVLGAGMTSGISSPAAPWFALTTEDPDLARFGKVKEWLDQVRSIMTATNLRTNLYSTLPMIYKDTGIFATAPFIVSESFTGNVFHTTPFDVGTYAIAEDSLGRVNTFVREFRMTVGQLVDMFGEKKDGKAVWDNFSNVVKNHYNAGNTETWIEVCHVICPNRDYDPRKPQSKFKKFTSTYYEASGTEGVFLRESGYDLFPVLAPRWSAKAGDVLGTDSPGIMSLGDVKQLQHGEIRGAEALDKSVRPPMMMSAGIKDAGANLLPGGVTWVDDQNAVLKPAYQLNYPFNQVEAKQQQIRERINEAFFKNLFLMLANDQRSNITAREIDARYEEKLVMLGPVLQQFNSDCLDPLIDIQFAYHLKQGLLPPPPEELQGSSLKIEYQSVIARAQKTIGINSLDRFLTFVANASKFDPTVLDKVNLDESVNDYADQLSINPKIVRSPEDVEAIRQQRAQAQSQQAQQEAMAQQAQAAQKLSQADLNGNNALTALLGGGE